MGGSPHCGNTAILFESAAWKKVFATNVDTTFVKVLTVALNVAPSCGKSVVSNTYRKRTIKTISNERPVCKMISAPRTSYIFKEENRLKLSWPSTAFWK